jgi:hypothetical protein
MSNFNRCTCNDSLYPNCAYCLGIEEQLMDARKRPLDDEELFYAENPEPFMADADVPLTPDNCQEHIYENARHFVAADYRHDVDPLLFGVQRHRPYLSLLLRIALATGAQRN